MKIPSKTSIAAALSLLCSSAAFAQVVESQPLPPGGVSPTPLAAPAPALAPTPARVEARIAAVTTRAAAAADRASDHAQALALAHQDLAQFDNEVRELNNELHVMAGPNMNFKYFGDRNARPRTLILRTSTNTVDAAQMEEDMNIMAQVLNKGMRDKDDEFKTAMGVKLKTLDFAGGPGAQNLYLEGYGAIFFLNAAFPLVQAEDKPKEEPQNAPVDSAWEDAKRDLYGSRNGPRPMKRNAKPVVYDAEKVQELKESLQDRLKNAANIRGLLPRDYVSVVVTGSSSGAGKNVWVVNDTRNADVLFGNSSSGGPNEQSVLAIRARKHDIDLFAKGQTDYETFKKTLQISNY